MAGVVIPKLKRFFVFNPSLIKGDGPDSVVDAILYFHPMETPKMSQTGLVGFASAIIQFTLYVMSCQSNITCSRTFDSDMEVIVTKEGLHVFYSPEPGYWMVMV